MKKFLFYLFRYYFFLKCISFIMLPFLLFCQCQWKHKKSVRQYVCPSIHLSICPSMSVYVRPSVSPSVCSSVCLPPCLSVSVCLSWRSPPATSFRSIRLDTAEKIHLKCNGDQPTDTKKCLIEMRGHI